MKSERISLTLDHGIQSELAVIQALQEISLGRRQHQLRDWLSRGRGMVAAKGSSVDFFTASDKPSATWRVSIYLKPDDPEDQRLLNAVARVPKKSRSRWINVALILGFQNSTHIDINLDQIAPASPIQQDPPTDAARKESSIMLTVDAEVPTKITAMQLQGLFK